MTVCNFTFIVLMFLFLCFWIRNLLVHLNRSECQDDLRVCVHGNYFKFRW